MSPNTCVAVHDNRLEQVLPDLMQYIPSEIPDHGTNFDVTVTDNHVTTQDMECLPQLLTSSKWDEAIALIIRSRGDISQYFISIACQGEIYMVTPLHFAVGMVMNCPLRVLETLVNVNPTALLMGDSRRGLSPIHLGLLKGTVGLDQINYLLMVCPEIALHADMDGNLPLHLAVEYSSDEMIQRLLAACPSAAGYKTKRQRYPLHLFATSRCQIVESGTDAAASHESDVSVSTLKAIIDAYPCALQQPDLQGRLPMHLAACTPFPRWDIIQILCNSYPEALLVQDENHKIPVQLLKRFLPSSASSNSLDSQTSNPDNDVVLAFLDDRTLAEKRKKKSVHKLLSMVIPFKKKQIHSTHLNNATAIDLMNCYG